MKKKLRKKLLEELSEIPNVSLVCKRLGIARQTFYRWIQEDQVFKESVDESVEQGVQSMCDLAESRLLENIKNGNQRAIEYCLSNNSKRYIKPRPMLEIKEKKSAGLSNKEKDELLRILG